MGKSVLVGNINIWVHRMENILQWQQQLDNIQINRVSVKTLVFHFEQGDGSPKNEILAAFIRPHVVPNLYDVLPLWNTKGEVQQNVLAALFCKMKVDGWKLEKDKKKQHKSTMNIIYGLNFIFLKPCFNNFGHHSHVISMEKSNVDGY